MKHLKKTLAVFLSVLTILSIISTTTSVFAAEYTENKVRAEYFDSALSSYLKDIVDTDGAVKLDEKEKVEETVSEVKAASASKARSFSPAKNSPEKSSSNALKEAISDLNIDHTRLTLDLGDGENTAYLFSEPISFIDGNGELVYKDTNIEAVTDENLISRGYTYQNGKNDYKMYFSSDSDKGVLLVLKDGTEIKLFPNGSKTAGHSEKAAIDEKQTDVFAYPNAYGSDTLLRFLPQLNGMKDEIILQKYNGKNSFEFTLDVGENVAAINSRGEVEIIDANREIIQTFAAPFAYDAEGNVGDKNEHYTDCTYSLNNVSDGVYELSVNVPEEFLTSKNTVYPVTIDPVTEHLAITTDAGVYSAKANNTYGSEESACVGKTGTSEYGKGRAMFYFRVPADIKAYAKISSAKLWLREVTGRTATTYVRPYLIKESWTSTVTWNTQPPHYSTFTYPGKTGLTLARRNINSASTDKTDNPYWYGFNITDAIRAWTTGTSNKGLKIIAECEAADGDYLWRAFATEENTTSAYRPYAVISYANDTTAPTISSVSGNPTAWTKNDVTLKVTATDDVYGAAGVASYSFDNGKTWQTSNSKKFTSNQTVNIKVKDKAGNISAAKAVKITKIDKTAPTISKVALSPSSWTNGSVKVTVTASDAGSGLNAKAYSFDNGTTWQAANNKTYSANDSGINVKVRDVLGNIATYASNPVKVANIDKTAPTIKITYSPATPTNGDVTATITIKDDKALGKYKIGTDSEVTVSGTSKTITKKYTKNTTEDIAVWDAAGNPKTATIKVANIDKTKPTATITLSPTSWTNGSVTATIVMSDNVALKNYVLDGASAVNVSGKTTTITKSYSSNQSVSITVTDTANNSVTVTKAITNIDKTEPVINSVSGNPDSWTSGNVTLTVNATDNESGVVDYCFNGIWQGDNPSFTVPSNGIVKIRVKDAAGNISDEYALNVSKIDKSAPVIKNVSISPSGWTNGNVTVTVSEVEETGSGIAEYFFNGVSNGASPSKTFSANGTVKIKVKDKVGHVSQEYTVSINNIDKTKPVVGDVTVLPSDWTNGNVTLSVSATDDLSGIAAYSFDNGATWKESNSKEFDSNQTVYVRVKDNAGNISDPKAVEIGKIDKEAPVINDVSVSEATWTNKSATVTVDATDALSGIAEYSFDGGSTWSNNSTSTIRENTENIIVAVKDNAGNISYYKDNNDEVKYTTNISEATPINITNIDKTAPTAPDIYAESGTIYISSRSFNFNEETESPEHLEYKLGESGAWTAYEDALTLVNTYDVTVYARVRDEAGNISGVSPFTVKSTLGEYTTAYTDIAYGEGLFPIPFERTYSSTNGWFFSFNANVQHFTNDYVFTDFSGEKHYFIKNGEEKYVSADGDELELNVDNYAFKVPYGELECYFDADGKLASIAYGNRKFSYVKIGNKMRISEDLAQTANNGTEFTDELIDGAEITTTENADNNFIAVTVAKSATARKTVQYTFDKQGHLLSFVDASNVTHSYTYNTNGLLTQNETETIDYSTQGRVKRITQQNGAFVKFTYNDTFAQFENDAPIGKVTVSDSKGVTDTWYYKDGITISSSLDNYSDEAVYDPDNISNALAEDTVANIAYAVKYDDSSDLSEGGDEAENDKKTPLYERLSDGGYMFYKYDSLDRVVMSVEIPAGVYFTVTQNTTFEDALSSARIKTITSYDGNTENISEWETSKLKIGIWQFVNTEKESYTYYENGEMKSLKSYAWGENDWNPVLEEEYDNKGNTTLKIEYEYGGEVTATKTLFKYDTEDRIIEQTISVKTGTTDFVDSTKEEYKYNSYGDTDTYTVSQWLGNAWYQTNGEEYEYNGYGNNTKKTETVCKNTFNSETNLVETTQTQTVTDYVYDVWNQPVKTTVQKDNETEVVTNVVYDILGRTTSVTEDGKTTAYTYDGMNNVLTVTDENGTTTYTYDASGKLLSRTDPDGKQASYIYDSYGNTTGHQFNGYSFTYNTLGSILTAGSAGSQLVSYTYSNNVEQNVLNSAFGNGQNVSYTYDEDGRITATKLGEETKYGYAYFDEKDADGKVTKEWSELTDYVNGLKKVFEENKTTVTDLNGNAVYTTQTFTKDENDPDSFDGRSEFGFTMKQDGDRDLFYGDSSQYTKAKKVFRYDDSGRLSQTENTFVLTEYGYANDSDRVTSFSNAGGDITSENLSYSYDEDGRITNIASTSSYWFGNKHITDESEYINYSYDSNGQLASSENGTSKNEYSYDSRGNILSKKEYAVSLDDSGKKVYTESKNNTYSYDDQWKDKLTSFNGQTITYDESGNPTNYLGHNLSWTMGRQLASYDDISYTYDENGMRASKTVNGKTTKYYYDGNRLMHIGNGSRSVTLIYDRFDEAIGFFYCGQIFYYVKNLQGDITALISDEGFLMAKYVYDDWGNCTVITSSGTSLNDVANVNPLRYRGYVYDNDTGLYYLQSRYYDPEVGRFINCDDVNYIGVTESELSYNPFAYCENDPVNDSDPNGTLSWKKIRDVITSLATIITQKVRYFVQQKIGYRREGNYICIKTNTVAVAIDAIIVLGNIVHATIKSTAIKMVCGQIKKWAQKNTGKLATFLKDKIFSVIENHFPKLLEVTFRSICITFGIKSIVPVGKSWLSYYLSKNFYIYSWISALTSPGNLVANIFDIMDGIWDCNIKVKVKK